jgi:hypothetical protein
MSETLVGRNNINADIMWIPAKEIWTYGSADAPSFTFTISGDKTGKYSPGMRIKLTQSSTIKYFIITAISYSSPNTAVTIYGGTDYTLANDTITSPYYSMQKAPYGFPLNPSKWSVLVTDTNILSQSNPTAGVWYNMGNISITIPIGCWSVSYKAKLQFNEPNNNVNLFSTLSTANNTESDADFTACISGYSAAHVGGMVFVNKILTLASKTTYYLNLKTAIANVDTIYLRNDEAKLLLEARCVYL